MGVREWGCLINITDIMVNEQGEELVYTQELQEKYKYVTFAGLHESDNTIFL